MQQDLEKAKKTLEKANEFIEKILEELDQLMSIDYETMKSTMTNEDFAKFNMNLAYTLNALYYSKVIKCNYRFIESERKSPRRT